MQSHSARYVLSGKKRGGWITEQRVSSFSFLISEALPLIVIDGLRLEEAHRAERIRPRKCHVANADPFVSTQIR